MLHFMTGDEFLKLGKRDFENQTVLDEIHNSLQDRQLLLTEREELHTEIHRVMAALRHFVPEQKELPFEKVTTNSEGEPEASEAPARSKASA